MRGRIALQLRKFSRVEKHFRAKCGETLIFVSRSSPRDESVRRRTFGVRARPRAALVVSHVRLRADPAQITLRRASHRVSGVR